LEKFYILNLETLNKRKNSDVLFKKTKLKIEMLKLFIFKKVKVTKKFFGGKLKFTNKT